MKQHIFKFIFAFILALSLWMGATLNASAARAVPKAPTVITFTKLASIELANPFTVSGYYLTWKGGPIANENINLTINGIDLGQARTNISGFFQRKFTKIFSAGTYTISGSTKSTHYLIATKASTNLVILPTDVRVQTVPAISGVAFTLAGKSFLSGPDGIADIKIGNAGKYQLTVLPEQFNDPNLHIEFARWLDETFSPSQVIQVPAQKVIQVGFNVYQQVSESFVDLGGNPVDSGRVKQFTLKSAQGDLFVFKDGQPRWIPASRIARFQNGLVATPLMYSVINLTVDGANVVNKAQERFFASPNGNWKITLILYSLSIRANDGLFGSSVGRSIDLVYPDGLVKNFPLDKNGTVTIHSLARGNYTVQVMDARGLRQVIPVALSRSQTVDIKVPTTIDMVIFISIGLFTSLGLILFGRLRARRSHMKSTPPAIPAPQGALVKTAELQTAQNKASLAGEGMI